MSCFQGCLDALHQWSHVWQLPVSSHKCCSINIDKHAIVHDVRRCFLGTEFIYGVPEYESDLGVVIDKDLSFTYHINRITGKAYQRANLMHRCFVSKIPTLLKAGTSLPSNMPLNVAWAEAYLPTKRHLDPSNRLATIHHHRQTDRTDNGPISIGRIVLQTVLPKSDVTMTHIFQSHILSGKHLAQIGLW